MRTAKPGGPAAVDSGDRVAPGPLGIQPDRQVAWIPAFAGMTRESVGMTIGIAGMTKGTVGIKRRTI